MKGFVESPGVVPVKVVMVVPLTLLLPGVFHMGADGVFIAEPISNAVGGTACLTTMLCMVLPELRQMEEESKKEL